MSTTYALLYISLLLFMNWIPRFDSCQWLELFSQTQHAEKVLHYTALTLSSVSRLR